MWWYKLKFGTGVQGVFWNPRVDNGAGDIDCAQRGPAEPVLEPGVKDIQDSRDFFCLAVVPVEALRDAYGDKVKEVRGGWSVQPWNIATRTTGSRATRRWWWTGTTKEPGRAQGAALLQVCGQRDSSTLGERPGLRPAGILRSRAVSLVFDPMFPVEDSRRAWGTLTCCAAPGLH